MVICHCEVVSDAMVREHIAAGGLTADDVASRCRAGSQCGACRPAIERLIREVALELPPARLVAAGF